MSKPDEGCGCGCVVYLFAIIGVLCVLNHC